MRVVPVAGTVAELHDRPVPAGLDAAEAWLFEPSDKALVLGSSQALSAVSDRAVQHRSVLRRRSGGGAVAVDPATSLWLDVLVPRTDPRWSDDVRRATYWLGEVWQAALGRVGIEGEVYQGALQQTAWGRLVCFGAVGPGEVLIDGRKAVGIAQRRTKDVARFQCIVYAEWDPAEVVDDLDLEPADRARARAELAAAAVGVGPALAPLRDAVVAELSRG